MGNKGKPINKAQQPEIDKSQNPPGFEALEKALKAFTQAMRERLLEKHSQGVTGWNNYDWIQKHWKKKVDEIVTDCNFSGYREKDCVDLANFFLFKFFHQKGITAHHLKKKLEKANAGN